MVSFSILLFRSVLLLWTLFSLLRARFLRLAVLLSSQSVHVVVHVLDASVSIDVISLVTFLKSNLANVRFVDLLLNLHSVQIGKVGLVEVRHANGLPLYFKGLHHHRVALLVEGFILDQIGEKLNVRSCARTK